MTLVKGDIRLVTNTPAAVSQVWVRAPKPRTQGLSYVSESSDTVTVSNGVVEFTALPGAAVMVLVQNGVPTDTIKLNVPDKETASLRECIDAVGLVDDGTMSTLEKLALDVAENVARIGGTAQIDAWVEDAQAAQQQAEASANKAETFAGESKKDADRSGREADRSEGAADASESSATRSENSAQQSVGIAATVNTMRNDAKGHADRAEFAANETIAQVEGDFATRNYVDEQKWDRGVIGSDITSITQLDVGSYGVASETVANTLGLPGTLGNLTISRIANGKSVLYRTLESGTQKHSIWLTSISSGAISPWTRIDTDTEDIQNAVAGKADTSYVNGQFTELEQRIDEHEPRLLDHLHGGNQLVFSVVDENNRRTWLEVAPDGGPTEYARELIGANGASSIPDFPVADWAHWGDSNSDDWYLKNESWTSKLAQLTGKNHYMGGYYNQKSINIAARQGGAPSLVTVAQNRTSSSGATEIIDAVNPVTSISTIYEIPGTLAGVHGSIKPLSGEKQTFTPTQPGIYNIPPRSVFTPDAARMRNRHVTIWMGRNDRYDDGAAQQVARSARHMVDYLTPRVKRFLVLQLVPGTEGLNHPRIKPINDMLQSEFPSQFVPIAEWMMTDRAADLAGISYTAQDIEDIAAGRIPTSFRSDNAHFNGPGCTAIAHFLYEEILTRGWL